MKTPELKRKLASLVIIALILCSMSAGMVSADVNYPITVAVTTTTASSINYATFTATENGAAKENVEIYIDELFYGTTDTSGIYSEEGLTDGTHEWKAKYRGATYDSGSFVFFNYTITAKGTKSSPQSFTWKVDAWGTETYPKTVSGSVAGSDGGTKERKKKGAWKFAIKGLPDQPVATGVYLAKEKRWVTVDIDYGVTFDSIPNPTVSWPTHFVSSDGYIYIGGGLEVYDKTTSGCKVRVWVYYDYYTIVGNYVGSWIYKPQDHVFSWSVTGHATQPVTGSHSGSGTTYSNNPYTGSYSITLAPQKGGTISGIDASVSCPGGVSCSITKSVSGNTISGTVTGTTTAVEPWSAAETGKASVTSKDTDKFLIKSSLVAPNADTTYSVSITVDGMTYYAKEKSDIGIAKGHNVMAWTVGNELHATMKAAGKEDHLFDYGILAKGERSPLKSFSYTIESKGTRDVPVETTVSRNVKVDCGFCIWCNEKKETFLVWPPDSDYRPISYSHRQNGKSLNGCWVDNIHDVYAGGKHCKSFDVHTGPGVFGCYCPQELTVTFRKYVPVSWSATPISGTGEIRQGQGEIEILQNLPEAPNKDTTYTISLTVDGQTHTAVAPAEAVHIFPPGAPEKRWLKLRIENKKLYASTNYFELWSDKKSGSGSVNSSEIVKSIDTYDKPFPPYTNIEGTIYPPPVITVNSTIYKDSDDPDQAVECGGFNAWSDRTLYASVGYLPPAAIIDNISPKLTVVGEKVSFEGHGESGENPNGSSPVIAYKWRSSKDGFLSGDPDFNTSLLSPARHVIFFKVEDEDMIWSPEAIDTLSVNKPPVAYISSIYGVGTDANGETVAALGDPVRFVGVGIDTDGYIAEYVWSSSLDGLLSNEPVFTTSSLSEGTHTLSFKVKDNKGAWSKVIKRKIKVTRLPVLLVHGYLASPESMNKIKDELEREGFDTYTIDLRRPTDINLKVAYEFASSTQEPIDNLKNINGISRDFQDDFTNAFKNDIKKATLDKAWEKLKQLFKPSQKKLNELQKSVNDLNESSTPEQREASKDSLLKINYRIKDINETMNNIKNGSEDYTVLLPKIEGLEKDVETLNKNYPLNIEIGSGDVGISQKLIGDIPIPIILPDIKVPFLKKKIVELVEKYFLEGEGVIIYTHSEVFHVEDWTIKVEGDFNAKNIHLDAEQKNLIFDLYFENVRLTGEGKIEGVIQPSGKVMEFIDQFENNGFAGSIGLRLENLFSGKPRFVIKLSAGIPFLHLNLANSDIKGYSGDIGEKIDEIKRETGLPKVDLVGHNMGAVASRQYVNYGYKDDVRKLVMLGSPNHGSDVAFYGPKVVKMLISTLFSIIGPVGDIFGDLANNALDYVLGEAIGQMETHSPFIKTLNANRKCAPAFWIGERPSEPYDLINPHVQHDVIAGSFWWPPTLSHGHIVVDLLIGKINIQVPWIDEGDVLVTTKSARVDNMPLEKVDRWNLNLIKKSEPIDKVKAFLYSSTSSAGINSETYTSEGYATLVSDDDPPPAEPNSETPSTVSEASQWFDPMEGEIFITETKMHSITLDTTTTEATFTLRWLGDESDLNLTLFSPDGATINPSSADNETIIYNKRDKYIVYNIKEPGPGEWSMEIIGTDTPEEGTKYYAFVTYNTELFVGIGTDEYQYKPNENVTIYAYVQDDGSPLAGASVIAEVRKPDTIIDIIPLYDDGSHQDGNASDGIYANVYTNTSLFGAYDIFANATIVKDSKQYSRVAGTTIWIETNPDLTLNSSDIFFSKDEPIHGEKVTISALIHNRGDGNAANAKIIFYDGDPAEKGMLIGHDYIDVPTEDTTEASVSWNATFGNRTIHVIIDPFSKFLEKNYTNNRANRTIFVGDPISPKADAGPDQIATVNTTVFFDGSGSEDNVNIVNYSWDIDTSADTDGDGIHDNDVDLTGINPAYSGYDHVGTYIVKLKVSDAAGNEDSDTLRVTVTTDYDLEYPVADAGNNQTVTVGEPVIFDGSKSEDNFGIATYFWDTDTSIDADGDGIHDNDVDLIEIHPTLKSGYLTYGVYTVQLTVDDAAGNGPVTDTMTVTVKTKPDLFVGPEDVISTPSTPTLNQEVETIVVIHNGGETDVQDAKVEFWLNGALKESRTVSVAGNSTITDTFNWIAIEGGLNEINIKLDPDNHIDEEYEGNNEIHTYIMVEETIDTTPPVIESVTFDGYTTIPDAAIHVTVEATDNVGVTSVTADEVSFVETGNVWAGNITVPSTTGDYTLTIRAEDEAKNFNETTVPYSVVIPVNGLGVAILPKVSTASPGSTLSLDIKIVSTENFDDVVYVYLTVEGIPSSYQANLSWFNWTDETVGIPIEEEIVLPIEVAIPNGTSSGYKSFGVKAESTKWHSKAQDYGAIMVTGT